MQSTQTSDPLAQLSDIHPPAEVAVWPLDWGWWLLIGIALTIQIIIVFWAVRRYRFYRGRREALAALRAVSSTQHDWPTTMNTLLKRTAITYFGSHRVASLYGMAWLSFLESTLPDKYWQRYGDGLSSLNQSLYRPTSDKPDFVACQAACSGWVRHARLRATVPQSATASESHDV